MDVNKSEQQGSKQSNDDNSGTLPVATAAPENGLNSLIVPARNVDGKNSSPSVPGKTPPKSPAVGHNATPGVSSKEGFQHLAPQNAPGIS